MESDNLDCHNDIPRHPNPRPDEDPPDPDLDDPGDPVDLDDHDDPDDPDDNSKMARQGRVSSMKKARKTSKEYKEKFRSKRSSEERELERRNDKNRKSEKRLNMTEEERNKIKEKDRIRKQKERNEKKEKINADLRKRKAEGEFAHKGEYYRAKDKRFKACGMYMKNKNDAGQMAWYNRYHKGISRDNCSEEQKEFEKIEQVIMKRKQRHLRAGKAHLMDNLQAKREMRSLRENGPLKDYMRRKAREQDEEILWKKFWEKGAKYRELLLKKKPEFVRLFMKERK